MVFIAKLRIHLLMYLVHYHSDFCYRHPHLITSIMPQGFLDAIKERAAQESAELWKAGVNAHDKEQVKKYMEEHPGDEYVEITFNV